MVSPLHFLWHRRTLAPRASFVFITQTDTCDATGLRGPEAPPVFAHKGDPGIRGRDGEPGRIGLPGLKGKDCAPVVVGPNARKVNVLNPVHSSCRRKWFSWTARRRWNSRPEGRARNQRRPGSSRPGRRTGCQGIPWTSR